MISRLTEAIRLMCRHFSLFAGIILTVWLPGNLITGWFNYIVIFLFYWEARAVENLELAQPIGKFCIAEP
jgi:hypothetical protein